MLESFCPKVVVDKVEDLDLSALRARGFTGLVFDLDNTLVSWRRWSVTPGVLAWLREARELGFHMCILSNCLIKRRVRRFSRHTGIPALPKAKKPARQSFEQALRLLGTRPDQTAVIGDQLFTDVFGGNRMGLFTILVRPIERREFYFTFFQRAAESAVLRRLERRGMLSAEGAEVVGGVLRSTS